MVCCKWSFVLKITFLRHAEVDEAYSECYNGHIDIGLSSIGYKQAKKLAKHFDSLEFDEVFCSDLIRAKETLSNFRQNKQAIFTDKLREKSWGKHEGLNFETIIAQDEIKYENFTQWINALDGEDYKNYTLRIKEFFNYLKSLKKENILVVTHAGVIRTIISLVKNISLEDTFNKPLPYASHIIYNLKNNSLENVILV